MRPQIQRVFCVRKLLVCSIPFQWIIELHSSKVGRRQKGKEPMQWSRLCCFRSHRCSETLKKVKKQELKQTRASLLRGPSIPYTTHLPLANQQASDLWGEHGERQRPARMTGVTGMEMSRVRCLTQADDAQSLVDEPDLIPMVAFHYLEQLI